MKIKLFAYVTFLSLKAEAICFCIENTIGSYWDPKAKNKKQSWTPLVIYWRNLFTIWFFEIQNFFPLGAFIFSPIYNGLRWFLIVGGGCVLVRTGTRFNFINVDIFNSRNLAFLQLSHNILKGRPIIRIIGPTSELLSFQMINITWSWDHRFWGDITLVFSNLAPWSRLQTILSTCKLYFLLVPIIQVTWCSFRNGLSRRQKHYS